MTKNKRYGVWDIKNKRFVFNINEDSKNRAMRALQQRTGKVASANKYTVRPIPDNWRNPPNKRYQKERKKPYAYAKRTS